MIAIIKFLFIATIISLMLTIAMTFAYHWAMKRLDDINRWNDGTAKIASAAGCSGRRNPTSAPASASTPRMGAGYGSGATMVDMVTPTSWGRDSRRTALHTLLFAVASLAVASSTTNSAIGRVAAALIMWSL